MHTPEFWNKRGAGKLPGHLGMVVTHSVERELRAELAVGEHLMAPNGFLHAGSLVTLADTCCGYGCVQHLPEGARGFTTVELKSNFRSYYVDYAYRADVDGACSSLFNGLCYKFEIAQVLPQTHVCGPTLKVRSQPLSQTVPASGASIPETIFSAVLFPLPLRPTSTIGRSSPR